MPSKKADAIELKHTEFKQGKQIELLADAPKEFRATEVAQLKNADAPLEEAYSAYSALGWNSALAIKVKAKNGGYESAGSFAMKGQGAPMTFNRRTQSFVVVQPETQSGRTSKVEVPIGGRVGSVQANGNGATTMRPSANSGAQSYSGSQSYNRPQSNGSAQSYGGAPSRPATTIGSNTNNGSSTRTYTPPASYSAPPRSYSPPPTQTYSPPLARSYTPPPAPSYSPPPAPSYSPPPAPSYSPPPAPASSGGSIRR